MIITQDKVHNVQQLVGESDGFNMSLSNEDMTWLMTMLSDLYKDGYGIVPQEWY